VFLPIGDSPNPPGRPWVTYALIAANVAVYLWLLPFAFQAPGFDNPALLEYLRAIASERGLSIGQLQQLARQVSVYDLVIYRYGFRPAQPSLSAVLTSMFLHGGIAHLLGNMLFLWIYGDNVEHRLGRLGYLAVYLGTGLIACLGDGVLRLGSGVPSVGASGAISGVLGLYFVWFPRNRVRVWIFLFPFFADIVELPARLVLGLFIVVNNLLPMILTAGDGGVSYGAHIGGFAAGAALAYAGGRLALVRPGRRVRRPAGAGDAGRFAAPGEGSGAVDLVGAVDAESFRAALDAGRWDSAAEWFFAPRGSVARRAIDPRDVIHLGDELLRNGHPRAALAAFQRALVDHPRGPGRAAAHLGAARVMMGPLRNPTGAYQHLYAALEEEPGPAERAEARALLQALAGMVRSMPRGLPR